HRRRDPAPDREPRRRGPACVRLRLPAGERERRDPRPCCVAIEWRRRESNPRPQPHRMSIYKLRLPFDFARRPECNRPTVALAILQCRASGDWLSLCAEPVSWRRSGPRAQLGGASPTSSYELGSECEITRIRICFLPVDLRGQPATSACSSTGWIDHVETRSPPYVCVSPVYRSSVRGHTDLVAERVGEDAEADPRHMLRRLDDRPAELLRLRQRRVDVVDADEEEDGIGPALQRADRGRERAVAHPGVGERVPGERAVA